MNTREAMVSIAQTLLHARGSDRSIEAINMAVYDTCQLVPSTVADSEAVRDELVRREIVTEGR